MFLVGSHMRLPHDIYLKFLLQPRNDMQYKLKQMLNFIVLHAINFHE